MVCMIDCVHAHASDFIIIIIMIQHIGDKQALATAVSNHDIVIFDKVFHRHTDYSRWLCWCRLSWM